MDTKNESEPQDESSSGEDKKGPQQGDKLADAGKTDLSQGAATQRDSEGGAEQEPEPKRPDSVATADQAESNQKATQSKKRQSITFVANSNTNSSSLDSALVTLQNTETGKEWKGRTPYTFKVPPGKYTWTVQKSGYFRYESQDAENYQTVDPQKDDRIKVPLSPTVLRVDTKPDSALVTLRNTETGEEWKGRSPRTFDIPPGRYEYTVQKPGYKKRESSSPIDFQAPKKIEVPLIRLQRVLQFTTLTSDSSTVPATVTIQNQETGKTRKGETPHTFRVSPGKYTWTVRKKGYNRVESKTPIDLRESGKKKSVELSRKRHIFDFATTPDSATVTIQSTETGKTWEKTTPATFELPPGQYTWTVQKQGFSEKKADEPITLRQSEAKQVSLERVWPTFKFSSTPESARVTLRNVGSGKEWSNRTPHTFQVPPGQYEWEVEKQGYMKQESERPFNLLEKSKRSESVELTQADVDAEKLLAQGLDALKNENYREAINALEQVPASNPEQDDTAYLRAQSGLAKAYVQVENYQRAIKAYKNITERDRTRYEAFLNLAKVYFEIGDYDKAEENLGHVARLKRHAPASKRRQVQLQVDYYEARILYQQFKNAETPSEKRAAGLQARQKLKSYVASAPTNSPSSIQENVKEAKRKLKDIRSFLKR